MGKELQGGGRDARPTEFPHGFVECRTCGARYCSRKVYEITHRAPYEFRCSCGPQGLYLRWKVEGSLHPEAVKQREGGFMWSVRKFFGGN